MLSKTIKIILPVFITFINIKISFCQILYLDKFTGNISDYRIIGTKEFVRLKFEQAGRLDVNYSYLSEFATDSSWGAGFIRNFESGGGNFRDLAGCTAVQIEIKGDGSFNTFHFELVETKTDSGDGETWTSPDVSLSSTDWNTMAIPITHFRRLSDSESRRTIDEYIEGDSVFVPKIVQYNIILTGKNQTDTTHYLSLREFKGCDTPIMSPTLPLIDDFELNSTIPYPMPSGNVLLKIEYNWLIKKSNQTALQIYFDPDLRESSEPAAQGCIRIRLQDSIDLCGYNKIEFDLHGDGSQDSIRLELVESTIPPANGETWVSDFIALDQKDWQRISLDLDTDFHQLFSRSDNICPEYVDGNRIRNHPFQEFSFIFIGNDLKPERSYIFIDNLHVSGKQKPDHSKYFKSFVISEPQFSPYRGDLIFEYQLNQSVAVFIKIYRLTGELVAEISSGCVQSTEKKYSLVWNGKSMNGLDLPNGLYLVKVNVTEDNGPEKDGLSHPKFIEIYK